MKKARKDLSREVGLEISSICGEYFLKSQHLHYGYWTSNLEVDITNLHIAQENYAKFLISHIPDGVKTILDVGSGTGQIAKRLFDMGYQVDCVSPSPFLTERTRELLGEKSNIFECRYEEIQTEKRYDLILFAESLQYIDLEKALQNTRKFLNNDGYMLICDVFKKDVEGNSAIGGGHKLNKFYDLMTKYPFSPIKNLDITEQTAPNLDILDDALKNVVQPVVHSVLHFLRVRYPSTLKFLRWKYQKQLNKVNEKYFNGGRTGEDFKKFKSYRLLLFKKQS